MNALIYIRFNQAKDNQLLEFKISLNELTTRL
jgi:hypothetical protein